MTFIVLCVRFLTIIGLLNKIIHRKKEDDMEECTGKVVRKIPGLSCMEWRVTVDDGPLLGQSFNIVSTVPDLKIGDRVRMKGREHRNGNGRVYQKFTILSRIG